MTVIRVCPHRWAEFARRDPGKFRAAIGVVPQDTVMFNATIGYNIGYGKHDADQQAIEAAARLAAIDGFICICQKAMTPWLVSAA